MENSDYKDMAAALRKAMKGFGTDEKAIIEVTASIGNNDRIKVREAFNKEFNRDLLKDLDSELGGNLKKTIMGLFLTPEEYDANQLYLAFKGVGTNEDAVSEVTATKTNNRLTDIKKAYFKMYDESLEVRMHSEVDGDYKKLLMGLMQCDREESEEVDMGEVEADCRALFQAGTEQWGTDETTFVKIFCQRSSQHLTALNDFYEQQYQKTLFNVINSEFGGDLQVLLKTIMEYHCDPLIYYANRIRKACKGWGTDDSILIRNLITVSNKNIIEELDQVYQKLFDMTLKYQIEDETSGDYKRILLRLVE